MPAPQEVLAELVIGVDHVGIAVQNLDESIEKWAKLFGAKLHSREINSEQAIEEAMLIFPNQSQIQLLSSIDQSSVISKFLAQHGQGVQQVALSVTNLNLAVEKLAEVGVSAVYPAGKLGSNGTSINFIHPKFTSGVLIELVEHPTY